MHLFHTPRLFDTQEYLVNTYFRITLFQLSQNVHGSKDWDEIWIDASLFGVKPYIHHISGAYHRFGNWAAELTHHVLIVRFSVKYLKMKIIFWRRGKTRNSLSSKLQRVQDQILQKQMAVSWKWSFSDP